MALLVTRFFMLQPCLELRFVHASNLKLQPVPMRRERYGRNYRLVLLEVGSRYPLAA